jgi:hypothetical protein
MEEARLRGLVFKAEPEAEPDTFLRLRSAGDKCAPFRSHHFKRKVCADERSRPAPYRVYWLVVYPDLRAAGGTCRSLVFSAAAPVLAAGIELKTSNLAVIYHAHRASVVYL